MITENCQRHLNWFQQCTENQKLLFFYEIEHVIVGYIQVLSDPSYLHFSPGTAEISSLFVLPSKRSLGYARAMIAEIEMICKEKGIKKLGLGVGVTRQHQPALALYIKAGYKPDGLGLYHKSLRNSFAKFGDTITIDNSTTLWFVKDLNGDSDMS